jgi:hypothetical protein
VKATVVACLALSLAVWTVFYLLTPDAPLSTGETVVVVGLCSGAVFLGRGAWRRARRAHGGADRA